MATTALTTTESASTQVPVLTLPNPDTIDTSYEEGIPQALRDAKFFTDFVGKSQGVIQYRQLALQGDTTHYLLLHGAMEQKQHRLDRFWRILYYEREDFRLDDVTGRSEVLDSHPVSDEQAVRHLCYRICSLQQIYQLLKRYRHHLNGVYDVVEEIGKERFHCCRNGMRGPSGVEQRAHQSFFRHLFVVGDSGYYEVLHPALFQICNAVTLARKELNEFDQRLENEIRPRAVRLLNDGIRENWTQARFLREVVSKIVNVYCSFFNNQDLIGIYPFIKKQKNVLGVMRKSLEEKNGPIDYTLIHNIFLRSQYGRIQEVINGVTQIEEQYDFKWNDEGDEELKEWKCTLHPKQVALPQPVEGGDGRGRGSGTGVVRRGRGRGVDGRGRGSGTGVLRRGRGRGVDGRGRGSGTGVVRRGRSDDVRGGRDRGQDKGIWVAKPKKD